MEMKSPDPGKEGFMAGRPSWRAKNKRRLQSGPAYYLFEFRKADSETGEGLDGAHFLIVDQYGKSGTAVSGNGGLVRFYVLPDVSYKLTETKAVPGYLKDNNIYTVEVGKYGDVVVNGRFAPDFTVCGEMRRVFADFFFTNKGDSGPVEGAVFELLRDGEPVAVSASLHSGLVLFENLPPGEYSLEQAVYPSGYIPEPQSRLVRVARDGKITVDGLPSAEFSVFSRAGGAGGEAIAVRRGGAIPRKRLPE